MGRFRRQTWLAIVLGTLVAVSTAALGEEPVRLPRAGQVRAPIIAPEPAMSVQSADVRRTLYLDQPPAADPGVPPPADPGVHVDELVAHAAANNPQLQATLWKARALGARVPQVGSLPDPQLMTVTFLESIQTAAGPQEVMLSLSQKFPWFGKLALRSQVAYHDAMAAYAEATAVELRVTEEVKRAYYDVYFLSRAIEETEALEPRLEDVIEIARTKYETGAGGVGLESVLQARVELSSLHTRLVELRKAKIGAQARLAGVLSMPPSTRIEPVREFQPTHVRGSAEMLVDLVEECQPELEARRYEYSRDQASVGLARRERWPDVTMSLNWYEIGDEGLSPVTNGEDAVSLGVGVNLPICRKRLSAAIREAQYRTAQSGNRYAATLDATRAEVGKLYAQFEEHDRVLEILNQEIVPDAQETFRLSLEAYRVGNLDFQQLIANYKSLLQYQIDRHRREALREQTIASLERAVGCAVTDAPVRSE